MNDALTRPSVPGCAHEVSSTTVAALARVLAAVIEQVAAVQVRVTIVETVLTGAVRAMNEARGFDEGEARVRLGEIHREIADRVAELKDAITRPPRRTPTELEQDMNELLAGLDAMWALGGPSRETV